MKARSTIIYFILMIACLLTYSYSVITLEYRQEYFSEDDKRLNQVWSLIEQDYLRMASIPAVKEESKIYKLIPYTQIEPNTGIRYKVFFATNNLKTRIQDIHFSTVFCNNDISSQCTVVEKKRLISGTPMKINNRKFGLINEVMARWIALSHRKLLYLTQITPYEKIMNNHSIYIVNLAVEGSSNKHSFIIFEDDEKKSVFAEF